MKYVTPVFLAIILCVWGYQEFPKILGKEGTGIWSARIFLAVLFIVHIVIIKLAWKKRRNS